MLATGGCALAQAMLSLNKALERSTNEHQKISQPPRTVVHRLLEDTASEDTASGINGGARSLCIV